MKTERLYSLDFLKILATVLIVFHHYQQSLGVKFEGINFYDGVFYFGWIVEFFFLLSGFFMVSNIEKIYRGKTFLDFFKGRFFRLVPLLATTALTYELLYKLYLVQTGELTNTGLSLLGTLITALGIHSGGSFSYMAINGPTWYVSVLLICYVEFYFLTYLSKRLECNPYLLYAVTIFIALGVWNYGINLPFLNSYMARGQYSFFFGLFLGRFAQQRLMRDEKRYWPLYLLCLGLVVWISYLISIKDPLIEFELNALMVFIYYPSVIILFLSRPLRKLLNIPFLGTLSKISFDVFLWHSPMLLMLNLYVMTHKTFAVNSYGAMFLFAGAAFLFGALSHYLIEKPINRLIDAAQAKAQREGDELFCAPKNGES